MSNSREASPDWLRTFEAPKQSILTLSSDSDLSPSNSSIKEDDIYNEEPAVIKAPKLPKEDKNQDAVLIDSGEESPVSKAPKSKSPKKSKSPRKSKSPKIRAKLETQNLKDDTDKEDDSKAEAVKEEISEKHAEPRVSSRLPLVMSDKVQRSKALVECEGESIDMSGDVGAVGRLVISDTPCGNNEMLLDLKGTIYKTTIVPSRTFCIVNFGQAEAKIEAIMNDFIQLTPHSNVYEAETMIEGTLEGFSFESDEETDKIPKANNQGNETEEQTNGKNKGKAEKTLGVTRKKGKAAVKAPKKVRRKAQVPKKTKNAKK